MQLWHLGDLTLSSGRIVGVLIHMQVLIGLISSSSQAVRENADKFDLKEKRNWKTGVKDVLRQSRPPSRSVWEPV